MPPKRPSSSEPPEDDLHYEDFDDLAPSADDDLAPIDLDALDDEIEEIEPPELGAPTAKLLDSIAALDDEIAPLAEGTAEPAPPAEPVIEAAPPETALDSVAVPDDEIAPPAEPVIEAAPQEQPAAELAPAAAEAAPAESVESGEPPAPPPTGAIYRVLVELPPDLSAQVIELRKVGEIADMPPPGIELAAPFRAADRVAVESALTGWARTHLPIQLEIGSVLAEVIDAQQYVAAWAIQPQKELRAAQVALQRALEPLIEPLPGASAASPARITIGDHAPPAPYPRLIGQMQRDLEPVVWDAETVLLLYAPEEVQPGVWETAGTFR